ncbi:hypothetical protein LIX60_25420 [Streptomyces sp. S07_1.15]|uniref:DUF6197 family protein n=1 Tax=Streptomyces sp. S07_1.15 TaxID=2873925 RepID=UPI001D13E8FE|nr:hypothetical protein [Streptomyces sp. S07_1.15]MCC3654744.1 hypothetical protein [Streptomyces sp. S07_1.15]
MHPPAPAPARDHAAPPVPEAVPDLDARMAATDAAMTVRLELAALALDVDASAPETVLRLEDVITGPVQLPEPEETPYPTPAAAALQRAARRLTDGGWCRGALIDAEGARCLYGAVRAEAPTARAEADALAVLLDAIRRRFPGAGSVPDANDRCLTDGWAAVRVLGEAARLADARGL